MCDEEGRLAAEFLCEDGLVYETISQQCSLPFKIGCEDSGRVQLQPPKQVCSTILTRYLNCLKELWTMKRGFVWKKRILVSGISNFKLIL